MKSSNTLGSKSKEIPNFLSNQPWQTEEDQKHKT